MQFRALATTGLFAVLWGSVGVHDRTWSAALSDTIWVAPTGPSGSGTKASPFTSLEAARDAARARRAAGSAVVVILRGGDYPVATSFLLGAADGGTVAAPAVWAAAPGERPRILGARPVVLGSIPDGDPFRRRLDPGAQANVKAIVVDDPVRGTGDGHRPRVPELFGDEVPLDLARWPDSGWQALGAVDSSAGPVDLGFSGPLGAMSPGAGAELIGYFHWDWSADHLPIDSAGGGHLFVPRNRSHYGWLSGQRVALVNYPAALVRPGQYLFDLPSRRLVVWPGTLSPRWIGDLDAPVIIIRGSRHLLLEGLTVGWTGGTGIQVEQGDSVTLDRVAVRYTGGNGIVVLGGHTVRVTRTEIVGAGYAALILEGGDRKTLEPGGHVAEDDRILRAGRWWPTQLSIWLRGVGQRVAHTEIADAEFAAILAQGNDFVIEENHIHHLLRGSRDDGAIYLGRDWTERGTVIRRNLFHDIGGLTHLRGNWEVSGVYLDDAISGVTVTENVFLRVPGGMHLGGGRDNLIVRNAFLCADPAVFLSLRGAWTEPTWHLRDKLQEMGYDRPPYSARYPALAHILDGDPWVPAGNVIDSNVATGVMFAALEAGPSPVIARGTIPITMDCRDTSVDPWIQAATRRSGISFPLLAEVGPRTTVGPDSGGP